MIFGRYEEKREHHPPIHQERVERAPERQAHTEVSH
jgi:hypothetical protein